MCPLNAVLTCRLILFPAEELGTPASTSAAPLEELIQEEGRLFCGGDGLRGCFFSLTGMSSPSRQAKLASFRSSSSTEVMSTNVRRGNESGDSSSGDAREFAVVLVRGSRMTGSWCGGSRMTGS